MLRKKAKVRHLPYVVPLAEHASIEALCITDRASIQPRSQPKTALMDHGLQPYSHT